MKPELCRGPHLVESVWVGPGEGNDRQVIVTRNRCGHTYEWTGLRTMAIPEVGSTAMQCLGPQLGAFTPTDLYPPDTAEHSARPVVVKKRRFRKDEA